MTGRQALVTGANGHLGFTLAQQLLAKGWPVRCSVRDPADPGRSAHLRAAGLDDLVALDVRDGPTFRSVAAGVDTLFHVAATYRFWTEGPEVGAAMIRNAHEGAANAGAPERCAERNALQAVFRPRGLSAATLTVLPTGAMAMPLAPLTPAECSVVFSLGAIRPHPAATSWPRIDHRRAESSAQSTLLQDPARQASRSKRSGAHPFHSADPSRRPTSTAFWHQNL